MRGTWRAVVAMFGALTLAFLAGCSARQAAPESVYGMPDVREIAVTVTGGRSSAAEAVIRGFVRDACTRVASVKQSYSDGTFTLLITTRRSLSDACADDATPFEATVQLPVRGLRSGEYVVVAGGVSTSFFLVQEGIPQEL